MQIKYRTVRNITRCCTIWQSTTKVFTLHTLVLFSSSHQDEHLSNSSRVLKEDVQLMKLPTDLSNGAVGEGDEKRP